MKDLRAIGYFSAEKARILHISIKDKLFQQFSTNVRLLSRLLQDWVELSTEWDFAVGKLRKSDWLLRNDPTPLHEKHPTLTELSEGLSVLNGLYKNMSSDIQKICSHIMFSGEKIVEDKLSNLCVSIHDILLAEESESGRNALVVRQENIRIATDEWLLTSGFHHWVCLTAQQTIHSQKNFSNIVVVGLTQDYPDNLFNSIYPENPIKTISHAWIKERKIIPGYFPDIAQITAGIEIESVNELTINDNNPEVAFDFLEPSASIDGRRLAFAAKRALAQIEKSTDEELVECRAYLLASGEVVFLPTANGSIDSIDPNAPIGERVQRIPIANLSGDSILLLRVGTSEGEAISNMANDIGGAEARRCRLLQAAWKARLKERMKVLGTAKVTRELQDRGIAHPWIGEWARAGTIRPNSITNFIYLLQYLEIEPTKTVEAMSMLRHLHQVAGMRFRSILKKKFESLDLERLSEDGYVILEMGDEVGIAKLGAFRCKSIGAEVFEVPEFAVKQLQSGIRA